MNIGIISNFSKSPYSNGLTQNVISLESVLRGCGFNVKFIDVSSFTKSKKIHKQSAEYLKKSSVIQLRDIKKHVLNLDILFNPAAFIDPPAIESIRKLNKKCKFVSIKYGNNTVARMQRWPITGEEKGASVTRVPDNFYDMTLLSPHFYYAMQAEQVVNNNEVGTIPYIWSPEIIKAKAKSFNIKDLYYKKTSVKNILVAEPNIEMSKNLFIPLLTLTHILKNNPNCFNEATIASSIEMLQSKSIKDFILNNLQLYKFPKRIFFDERRAIPLTLNKYNPLILSCQVFCELNYLYLEALYYGYPLVHNSNMLKNAGYHYNGLDCISSANITQNVLESHDDNLEKYLEESKQIAYEYDPINPIVIKKYQELCEKIIK